MFEIRRHVHHVLFGGLGFLCTNFLVRPRRPDGHAALQLHCVAHLIHPLLVAFQHAIHVSELLLHEGIPVLPLKRLLLQLARLDHQRAAVVRCERDVRGTW